jgi:hypothetical protein
MTVSICNVKITAGNRLGIKISELFEKKGMYYIMFFKQLQVSL